MLKATLGAGVPPISYRAVIAADSPIGFWLLNDVVQNAFSNRTPR